MAVQHEQREKRLGRIAVGVALGAALLFAANPVLRSVHFIVVAHSWCPEHQSYAHVDPHGAADTEAAAEQKPAEEASE